VIYKNSEDSTLKVFISHSWDDDLLFGLACNILRKVISEREITSISRDASRSLPPDCFQLDVAIDKMVANAKTSIAANNREVDQLNAIIIKRRHSKLRLAQVQSEKSSGRFVNVDSVLKGFYERNAGELKNKEDISATYFSTPRKKTTRSRIEEISDLENLIQNCDKDIGRLRTLVMSENQIREKNIVVEFLEAMRDSDQADRSFNKFSTYFAKSGFNYHHPSFQNTPEGVLIELACRILDSKLFILLFTDNFQFSPWCRLELEMCLKARVPSICIDASPNGDAATQYPRLTAEYASFWKQDEVIGVLKQLLSEVNDHR
jgi:hypothetical protein